MNEGAFLTAILEQPADRTVRLVYADWLEERGDPRAEVLRLEPASITPPRLKALCKHFDPAWLALLNAGIQCGDVVEITNGPFEGIQATIQEVDLKRGVAKVWLMMFCRQVEPLVVKLSEVCRPPTRARCRT